MEKIERVPLRPFTRFCMSIGAVPSAYLAGLTIEEQLLWLCSYLEKEVIPTVNNNGESVEELQELFTELQTYVNNYFDNLDVQEEINNKLDAMAEGGELEEIIADYLNTKAIICFDNVSSMKLAENLVDGSYAKTLGFYSKNDGGMATYKIREITNDDVVDEASIIALLDNSLIAELIIKNNTVNVKQFGAYGDGVHDDTDKIQKAINYFIKDDQTTLNQNYSTVFENNYPEVGGNIIFNKALYLISSTIKIPTYIAIDFNGSKIKATTGGSFINNYMFALNSPACNGWIYAYSPEKQIIKNGIIDGNNIENIRGFYCADSHEFSKLMLQNLYNGMTYPQDLYIDNININGCDFRYFYGDDFAILKLGSGENAKLDQLSFATSKNLESTDAFNSVDWRVGWSLNITNSLNGYYKITKTPSVTISNMHNENGYLELIGCGASIIDSNFYVNDDSDPIIKITDLYEGNAYYDVKPINLENVLFRYNYNLYNYSEDKYEIDISDYKASLYLNNTFRLISDTGYHHSVMCGISLKNDSDSIYNIYDNAQFLNKQIIPQKSYNRTTLTNIINGIDASDYLPWNIENGTYYYRIIAFQDIDRILGTRSAEFTYSANNKGCTISSVERTGYGITYRIYRGTATGSYTQYVDIPNPNNRRLMDNGTSVNGYPWKSFESATACPVPMQSIEYEKVLDITSGNSKVRVFKNTVPNEGNWLLGDIVINSNPSSNSIYGWMCTTAGTPGTWKSISLS